MRRALPMLLTYTLSKISLINASQLVNSTSVLQSSYTLPLSFIRPTSSVAYQPCSHLYWGFAQCRPSTACLGSSPSSGRSSSPHPDTTCSASTLAFSGACAGVSNNPSRTSNPSHCRSTDRRCAHQAADGGALSCITCTCTGLPPLVLLSPVRVPPRELYLSLYHTVNVGYNLITAEADSHVILLQ